QFRGTLRTFVGIYPTLHRARREGRVWPVAWGGSATGPRQAVESDLEIGRDERIPAGVEPARGRAGQRERHHGAYGLASGDVAGQGAHEVAVAAADDHDVGTAATDQPPGVVDQLEVGVGLANRPASRPDRLGEVDVRLPAGVGERVPGGLDGVGGL